MAADGTGYDFIEENGRVKLSHELLFVWTPRYPKGIGDVPFFCAYFVDVSIW